MTTTTHTATDYDWPSDTDARMRAAFATDVMLARMVRQALRDLAHHHEPYARVFQRCPGTRLAGEFNAGHVEQATSKGRAVMQAAYLKTTAASTVEPGLDTNELLDRVTGRTNLRLSRAADAETTREALAYTEDAAARNTPHANP